MRTEPPTFEVLMAWRRRKERIQAYHLAAEPILKEMVKLRSLFTTYAPIRVLPPKQILELAPDQIRVELTPDAQQLYSQYEKALVLLQGMYLTEKPQFPA